MAEMQDLDSQEVGEIEAVESQAQPTNDPKAEEIPDKYRGKSAEDIMRMHQEAEKLISRQAQEVGEVRKLADELIKSQLHKKPEAEKPAEVDFFENPQEAIRRAVEANPKVLAAEQYAIEAQRAMAKQRFDSLHPDAAQVVQDPEFVEWVKKSPVRIDLFKRAHAFDVDAGNELLSTFKEIRTVRQSQTNEAEKAARSSAMKAAAVETGGSGDSGKKVFRRADLINLKLRDPQKFAAMQDDIDAAYREGRVK